MWRSLQLKNEAFSVGLACVVVSGFVACLVITGASASSGSLPARFQLVAENQYLQLYLDYASTELAVVDRVGGKIWYSNPLNQKATGQIFIEYFTPLDALKRMNNHSDSVAYGQYEITEISNGIRIDYIIGLLWNDKDYLPTFISEERFNELILSRIENEKDRAFIRNNYVLISLEEAPEDYKEVSISQIDVDALFGPYFMKIETELTGRARADFIRHVLDKYRLERTDIESISQVTPELIKPFINTPTMVIKPSIWPWDLESMIKIIKSTGYNPVDKQYDCEMYNLDPPEPSVEVFTIPVEYRLDADSLVVRVPMKDVKYSKNVYTRQSWGMRGVGWKVVEDERLMKAFGRIEGDTVTFPLHTISLLRFFGAPDAAQEGYILIPDGSGALVNFAANRTRQTGDMNLQLPVYGQDLSSLGKQVEIDLEQELQRHYERAQLPVFGMNHGDGGFIAVIEEGDALASVVVETSGTVNPVDAVYPKFEVIPVGTIQLAVSTRGGGGAYINTYQERLPESDLQVRYMFLRSGESDYSGMARRLQQYLVDRYSLEKVDPQAKIPFYLDLIGGIHRQKPILGVPRQVVEPLTTYDQVKSIVDELQGKGVSNVVLRYTGWLEGGIEHVYPSKVFLEPALGNQSSFLGLVNYLKDKGVEFYPALTQTLVAKTRSGDGFDVDTHVAYSLNRTRVLRQLPSGTNAYVLSVSKLPEQVEGFLSDCSRYGITGLALRDLGININSDFQTQVDRLIDRQQARDIIADAIARMAREKSLIIDGANLYGLVHADHILNMPTSGSGFVITDEEVPFYQMVIRGYVNYAGVPINHGDDLKDVLLKSLEIGAYPYFMWSYQDSRVLKDTPFHYLLSIGYKTWLDTAVSLYEELNRILQPLQGQTIANHRQLSERVYETTYENGTRIIVNYRNEPVEIDGRLIDAKSYLVMEGEQ